MKRRGNNKLLCTLLFIASFLYCAEPTPISVALMSQKTFCFNQDMPRHTLMRIDISSGGLPFRLQIMFLRELLFNVTSSQNLTKSITTQRFGIYRYCITNEANRFNTLTFQFLSGVHAKDYSSHTQSNDYISSIQNQARIALMFINQIVQQNKEGLQIMSKNDLTISKFSIQFIFSLIFIGVILVLSYTQFLVIKNHMVNRKYI